MVTLTTNNQLQAINYRMYVQYRASGLRMN